MYCKRIKVALGLAFITLFAHPLFGQFYNGLNMSFGKNRVQYYDFYWQYYRFDRFDTYFNEYGRDLALYVEWYANKEMNRLETMLDYKLDRRIIFLVYNKLTDFRQSNLGLITGLDDYNTGGTTKIINNKVSLYYEGDHEKFNQQISSAIAEIILNEMLYGNELRENMANSTLISLPSWFSSGLLSYLGENWSVEIEDHVKDGILSGRYKKYNRLTGDEATYAGHSFWKYIEKNYGKTVIPNIIYITRVNKNLKSSFLYVLGTSLRKLSKDWYAYYYDKYQPYSMNDANLGNMIEKKPKKNRIYLKIKVSPNSDYVSYVTNELGQYRLWLYNNATGKRLCLLKREHKIDQIPDYTFPVVAWHPGSRILTFITEEKGGLKLWFYNIEDKTLNSRNLLYFEKVLDFSYSPDGSRFVLSAVKEGKTDIYVHTLASATDEQITNDLADDLNPRFFDNGKKIIFSSNRLTDSIVSKNESKELSAFFQLYTIPYPSKNQILTSVTTDKYANNMQPQEVASNRFAYLGDNNGIINRYIAEYDSSISFVDTTIHYRYYTISNPVTNTPRNIIEHDYNSKSNKIGQSFLKKNKYFLFQKELEPADQKIKLTPTEFKKEYIKSIKKKEAADSVKKSLAKPLEPSELLALIKIDSAKANANVPYENEIDINRYIFEIEKKSSGSNNAADAALALSGIKDSTTNKQAEKGPQIIIYQPAFYVNTLASQIDFTFLSTSYQVFNGSNSFYNPGFNVNLKIGTNDLFEDYKIVGGMRFGVDFDSNEYLLSIENLKHRLDKQIVFHRQAFKTIMNESEDVSYYVKTVTNEGFYILRYPLNQVFSVRGTASIRHDRTAFLAFNKTTLDKANINNVWAGLKTELVFDNTRRIGVNLYNGTRWKVFGEAFRQVNRSKSDLFVLGADYRHYLVIHRNLILANRVAGSTSFGGSRLLYYLGGVDNWLNFSSRTPTFDNSIRIDNQEKYAFQATATNMRGFSQNVRNGNSFLLSNNEVRWPFITYFANYPVSSSFWSSLQLVGFFDVGSAWTGLNPFKGHNAYQFDETNGYIPVKMIVDSNRAPFVFGYGYGIRAQLLGYFMRFDWAWGVENNVILPPVFYFSLNLDF
jgi:Tol biopolymer transport system component